MRICVLLWLTFACGTVTAQTVHHSHNVFWGRIVLGDNITPKLRTELWVQKRTQDTESSTSMFDSPQYDSYWLWFSYNVKSNLKVSISPFGYFKNYILYTQPSDLDRSPVKEFRYCLRLEHEVKLPVVNYSNRFSLEYRMRDLVGAGSYDPNWRLRYMARFEKQILGEWLKGHSLSLVAYDEVMVQFGKAVRENPSIFDQNRLYAGVSYSLFKNIKVAPGYLFTVQQRPSGDVFDYINTFWVVVTFDRVVSQFLQKSSSGASARF